VTLIDYWAKKFAYWWGIGVVPYILTGADRGQVIQLLTIMSIGAICNERMIFIYPTDDSVIPDPSEWKTLKFYCSFCIVGALLGWMGVILKLVERGFLSNW